MASHENDNQAPLLGLIAVLVGVVGVLVTALGVVVSVTVPEVRQFFKLDPPRDRGGIEAEKRALEDAVRALDEEKARGARAKAKLEEIR
ncbi:MAG: hypothetical protein IT372_35055 [Polyangiaceae bacterium]|nr:hypothetical protein [Polyangiaceae bacterium]